MEGRTQLYAARRPRKHKPRFEAYIDSKGAIKTRRIRRVV